MATAVSPGEIAKSQVRGATWLWRWVPYALGVFFFFSALRGVRDTNVVDTDAARHAMNGALIYDMVRTGNIMRPVAYAKQYYGHLPALSMPFHPPVFPGIEAAFFAVLGVNFPSARLAVAVAVGVSAVLLYRLILVTLGSPALASCVTVTCLSLWTYQMLARDVMLEFPALCFTLAALYCLRDMDRNFGIGRGLAFGVLAGAAVWTKQHTVFLGAVPILYAILTRRWSLLANRALWLSILVFGTGTVALSMFSWSFHGSSVDPNQIGATPRDLWLILNQNLRVYGNWVAMNAVSLSGFFTLCALAMVVLVLWKGAGVSGAIGLYLAWIISFSAVLLILGAVSSRYLFFLFPAVIALEYLFLFRGCGVVWGEARSWMVPALFAGAFFVAGFFTPPPFLHGPAEAAALTVRDKPTRILYAGEGDGNFVFAVRSLDSKLQTSVVTAEKLPAPTFEPASFEQFCRSHRIDWVVIEKVRAPHKWDRLLESPASSMRLEKSIQLDSTRTRWHGTIEIFRFTSASGQPGGDLELPVPRIGGSIGVKL
jgi:4-amino-4-deoxy-L-arabinose transferase-like glycosyltransferase